MFQKAVMQTAIKNFSETLKAAGMSELEIAGVAATISVDSFTKAGHDLQTQLLLYQEIAIHLTK